MSNEKHISIDRRQYEQQVAELCEARAKLVRLYDETPIDAEWLVACGGRNNDGGEVDIWFGEWNVWRDMADSSKWQVCYYGVVLEDGSLAVRTRGEFRRAAELLGIKINEAANAAEGE